MTDRLMAGTGFVLAALCAAGLGTLEVLLVPLRSGSLLIPISIAAAVAGNVALPWLARRMTGVGSAGIVPVAVWLVVVLGLAMTPRGEGDVLVSGGGGEEYVFYGLLFAGVIAAAIAVITFGGRPARPAPVSR
jgi:hypothetical protein